MDLPTHRRPNSPNGYKMPTYSVEVKKSERVIRAFKSISFANTEAIWAFIEKLADELDRPGLRVIVKNETDEIVIMAGLIRQPPNNSPRAA